MQIGFVFRRGQALLLAGLVSWIAVQSRSGMLRRRLAWAVALVLAVFCSTLPIVRHAPLVALGISLCGFSWVATETVCSRHSGAPLTAANTLLILLLARVALLLQTAWAAPPSARGMFAANGATALLLDIAILLLSAVLIVRLPPPPPRLIWSADGRCYLAGSHGEPDLLIDHPELIVQLVEHSAPNSCRAPLLRLIEERLGTDFLKAHKSAER